MMNNLINVLNFNRLFEKNEDPSSISGNFARTHVEGPMKMMVGAITLLAVSNIIISAVFRTTSGMADADSNRQVMRNNNKFNRR
jgi:hypothetical protein